MTSNERVDLMPNAIKLNLDKDGFLRDLSDWNRSAAEALARQNDIVLKDAHWEIIDIVQAYYRQFNIVPVTRVLISQVKKTLGPEKGRSIYLMKLFGGKPARLVAQVAGLPKPSNCD